MACGPLNWQTTICNFHAFQIPIEALSIFIEWYHQMQSQQTKWNHDISYLPFGRKVKTI